MNVSIGERWEKFIENTVGTGRYSSASEVVREGLRLLEEREARLLALRSHLNNAIETGGSIDDEDLASALDVRAAELGQKAR
ncbi:type II toxin-antitoxin system ParD family antitoxin [Ciceribacter sp. L1K23]|uniref:type II toxin-antitoxin system ParD family antitoxin n=1 Tax=Ciceribacter sp. L1K23 TaxID=2820276 RepID=UPI001B82CFC6|nr:type II toxin-antitoxin system ParD family antitoxin [Ciceribacter sp. L1K23]MBR0556291.1 type II toxin-antitoxin system ParD family antitoxin [Ciceribacter sp. L1K23]